MNKTCYFCKNKNVVGAWTGLKMCDVCEGDMHEFTPDADWLEYERLVKEDEELRNLKDITKAFAERCRIIFTQDIPQKIRSEYIKHAQYEYEEIKRLIDIIEKDVVKE
jgi:hypothetical protein